jgi:hypothetical protein
VAVTAVAVMADAAATGAAEGILVLRMFAAYPVFVALTSEAHMSAV